MRRFTIKATVYALIFILFTVWTFPALASTLQDSQSKKKSIDSQLAQLKKEKLEVINEKKTLENEKKDLQQQEKEAAAEYEEILAEIEMISQDLLQIGNAIVEAENDYNHQRGLLEKRLKVMYENSGNSILDKFLQSKSLMDFLEKLEYSTLFFLNDKQLIGEILILRKDIEFKKGLKEKDQLLVQQRADQKDRLIKDLQDTKTDVETQIRKSKSELAKIESEWDHLVKQSQEMAKLIKELQRKGKYIGGTMMWPVPSSFTVVSSYGMRPHPILKKKKMHTGIDIDGNKGDSIVAANKGAVLIAKWQDGYGLTVVVDHGGGITTLYAHCSKLLVKVGAEVKTGQVIAKIGSTGLSTGPHLHFEVRENGKTVNPLNGYLKKV